MEIGKKKEIIFDCKACGYHGNADSSSKLATFILNNPPDSKGGILKSTAGGKKTKEDRAREKAEKKGNKDKKGDDSDDGGDDDGKEGDWDKRKEVHAPEANDDDAEDEDWAVDVSDAAVEAREQKAQSSFDKIEAATKELSVDPEKKEKKKKKKELDDDEKFGDEDEREEQMEAIKGEVKAAMAKSSDGDADDAIKALMQVAKDHELTPDDLFGFIFAGTQPPASHAMHAAACWSQRRR